MDTPTALQRANASDRARLALDAHAIHNPALFASTLLDWQAAILNGLARGIDDVITDPACRLLVYYLAELMNVGIGFDDAAFIRLQHDLVRMARPLSPDIDHAVHGTPVASPA